MGIKVEENTVIFEGSEIDIYDALDLRNALLELQGKGVTSVNLDLSSVESLSTPAIQVVISAKATFDTLVFSGSGLRPTVQEEFKLMCLSI
ncbi:MAG: hypothetical protein OEV59_03410 [Deltaproteobacteria bacterium]|nr:hypothetical protein [Deltaproteobacteria bacterium]